MDDAVRLKRLELENFRGFETLDLDFEDDLTVLVGPNGAGKTTVVDAIVCASTRRINFADARLGVRPYGVRLTTSAGESFGMASGKSSLGTVGALFGTMGTYRGKPRMFVYRVDRQVRDQTPGTTEGGRWTAGHAVRNWDGASASYEDFFYWFKEAEDLENEQIRYENAGENVQLAAVRHAIMQLLPEFNEVRVRRQMPPFSLNPVLMLRKGQHELPFDALSEGERTTVAMVGDIARRLALLGEDENSLHTPATVIIDEIELHAHPGWQRQILRRLRHTFPNIQIITTTHSPIIVSEVEPRQLRVLKDFALVPVEHGPGRDANAVLEDVFGVAPRNEEVQKKLDALADAIDDDRLDEAEQLLAELDLLVPGGADPAIVYYRNLLTLMREP